MDWNYLALSKETITMPHIPEEDYEDLARTLSKQAQEPEEDPFEPSKAPHGDIQTQKIKNGLMGQKAAHREKLLHFIGWMTALSFLLLATVVLLQMIVRVHIPDYRGVSDSVVNILTVGVFGEIMGIVASIVIAVWKDPS